MDIAEITEIEDQYAVAGEPSLGRAYEALRERFELGQRDRETSLRLMFLAWYSCSEPVELTGLPESDALTREVFRAAFEALGGELASDPEVVFTAGLMASLFPYCCGSEAGWAALGARLTNRYEAAPAESKLVESVFDARGEYGKYFAHMWGHRH
jgi:hypothetical protein